MLKIGLTGSIGSGKTLVASIFEALGIDVFSADSEARMLLQDPVIKSAIIYAFGDQILDVHHQIVNKRLASIVFNHPPSLEALNAIIHPAVRVKLEEWITQRQLANYVIHEAAILFESGFYKECNQVIAVSAPEELRIERVMKRDNMTREDVLLRMNNQWNDDAKIKLADYVIINDGKQLVIPQVLHIHEKLLHKQSWKH